jgi:hypothetical protein
MVSKLNDGTEACMHVHKLKFHITITEKIHVVHLLFYDTFKLTELHC